MSTGKTRKGVEKGWENKKEGLEGVLGRQERE